MIKYDIKKSASLLEQRDGRKSNDFAKKPYKNHSTNRLISQDKIWKGNVL